jgi:antitoxin (DNA-binding transcriptional repressor) of toxin-antitoxin stability system
MEFISVRELRTKTDWMRRRLEGGTDLVLTKNGKPMALISPMTDKSMKSEMAALTQARALQALENTRSEAAQDGRARMGMDEIDAEIRAARRKRKA